MLVCIHQQEHETEVVFGKVIMSHDFGYMVLYRTSDTTSTWAIEFMKGDDDIYPRAQRVAYEMGEFGEADFAKAMSYSMLSYPYSIHKELRFGDNPMSLDQLLGFLQRYGFAKHLTRTDVRQKEMFIKLHLMA